MRLEPGPGYSGWCWRRSCVPRCRGRAGLRPPGGAAGHHRLGRRTHWLPGQLLDTLAQGGTTAVTYGWAGLLLALYGVVAMVAGTTLFARRDVAT